MIAAAEEAFLIPSRLEDELDQRWPGLRAMHPIDAYVAAVRARTGPASYREVPPAMQATCEAIRAQGGAQALEMFHRIALARLVEVSRAELDDASIPASLRGMARAQFERILKDVQTARRAYFLHENDAFSKDLALASLRLLPCGAEHVDANSGIPRSLAMRGGVRQAADVLLTGLAGGGFRPWLECHWDKRLLNEFSAAGYERFFLRVAELLECRPQARGLIGSSWWYDPAVARINPELAFLTDVPMRHGARRFRVGIEPSATRDALRFAAQRTLEHEAGRYQPCVYMLAWARRPLIAWARGERKRATTA